MVDVVFNGHKLGPRHLEVLNSLPYDGVSEKVFRASLEEALEKAGIPCPSLQRGQIVYWSAPGGQKDRGEILSIDRRSGKITADSKLRKRPVKLSEQQVRINADDL